MKTIGNLIKESRLEKGFTEEKLAEITHIRPSFISAIEKGEWNNLPEFGITLGFVKSIAHFLDFDERQAVSVFRRDYPPELIIKSAGNPKKQKFVKRFVWGPRFTFIAGILIVIMIIVGYLGFQFKRFNSPPTLVISKPKEEEVITSSKLEVKGKTDPDATININNQDIVVLSDGTFIADINVSDNTSEIVVTAKGRSGKETVVHRKIRVQI